VIRLLYYSKNTANKSYYFRIYFNFSSSTLLIIVIDRIRIRSANLKKGKLLLLITGTKIECGGILSFVIEFPNYYNYTKEYNQNY